MNKIESEKIEELHKCVWELSCIVYLQDIIHYENFCGIDEFCSLWDDVKYFLIKKEMENIIRLRNLIKEKDFAN